MVERQKRGFRYEKDVIERYGYKKSDNYGDKDDARDSFDRSIQIKSRSKNNALELGCAKRWKENEEDKILISGEFEGNKIISEKKIFLDAEKMRNQLPSIDKLNNIKEEMDKYDNPDDPGFQNLLRKVQKENENSLVNIRLKKDHNGQSRIQASVSNKDIEEFENEVKKKKSFFDRIFN
jgi:hypothetical protein